MQRVAVVGTTGSGKSTLAERLAARLGGTFVDLDALYWGPDWTPAPVPVLRERTSAALAGDCWAVAGNYSKVRDIVWVRSDTLVWLDYPLPLIYWRLLRRTLRRTLLREELWGVTASDSGRSSPAGNPCSSGRSTPTTGGGASCPKNWPDGDMLTCASCAFAGRARWSAGLINWMCHNGRL